MTPSTARLLAAAFPACIVTGLSCGLTTAPLANLVDGLAVGVPVGVATFGALTAAAWAMGARR